MKNHKLADSTNCSFTKIHFSLTTFNLISVAGYVESTEIHRLYFLWTFGFLPIFKCWSTFRLFEEISKLKHSCSMLSISIEFLCIDILSIMHLKKGSISNNFIPFWFKSWGEPFHYLKIREEHNKKMKLFSLLALLANQQTANGQNPVSGSVGQTTDGQMRFRLQELRLVNSLANAIKKCQCNENGVKPIDLNRYR